MPNTPHPRTWRSPGTTERYNFQRDPAFMEERVPNVSTVGMPTAADIAKNNGVPPVAIPYMILHNQKRPDGTGKRIIAPMVAGFESTFLANSLQSLLCLPGCESVFMGELANATAVSQRNDDGMKEHEEEPGGISMDEGDAPSARSSPLPPPAPSTSEAHHNTAARTRASGTSSPRSPSSGGSDINSLGPSGELDAMTTEEVADSVAGRARDGCAYRESSGENEVGEGHRKATRVLRGGIRCHGNARVKTVFSHTYANFVLQHLDDGEIQLKAPAQRSTSAAGVTHQLLDEAGELETLRGQTPNVPRCLAPVALPEEQRERSTCRSGAAALEVGKLFASTPHSPSRITSAGGEVAAHKNNDSSSVSVVAPFDDAKMLLTTSEHSCSDNSPTPSSADGDEDADGAHVPSSSEEREAEMGGGPHHHRGASAPSHALAGETRVGVRHGAQDGRRFTCFASNSVVNMPEYHFPRLESDDLVELTAFMVVRSSVQPDEAVDLDLATHILGDPHAVARLPPEMRTAAVNRAARLMEAAVFLQI
ncbi:hypothetical protein ABL78_6366 [Leptomonas seymouri]|uniref:Uncharacterized protein n=1 Tax=Leptomonas seymouri TaxID=5684 RepID=A0A0N0P3V5_LEPSE|nr:hypothetical protein ABL78_6366 [Leptomonas seymouri]|eukprot:KPI84576.1 hypothetical protein ABL78_6366 [Leptomonas seymouri]